MAATMKSSEAAAVVEVGPPLSTSVRARSVDRVEASHRPRRLGPTRTTVLYE